MAIWVVVGDGREGEIVTDGSRLFSDKSSATHVLDYNLIVLHITNSLKPRLSDSRPLVPFACKRNPRKPYSRRTLHCLQPTPASKESSLKNQRGGMVVALRPRRRFGTRAITKWAIVVHCQALARPLRCTRISFGVHSARHASQGWEPQLRFLAEGIGIMKATPQFSFLRYSGWSILVAIV